MASSGMVTSVSCTYPMGMPMMTFETFLTLWIMGSLKWRPAWETVSAFPRVMTTA